MWDGDEVNEGRWRGVGVSGGIMGEGNGVRTSEPLSPYAQSTLALLSMFFPLCTVVKYTPDQIRKMEDSIRIRKASEPVEVKEIKKEFLSEQSLVELPQHLKQKITDEIVGRLRGLRAGANVSEQRGILDKASTQESALSSSASSLAQGKAKSSKTTTLGKTLSSTVPPKEAGRISSLITSMFGRKDHCHLELQGDMLVGTLARASESGWSQLSNEIGLWIPVEINNEEHDDKLEGATDFNDEILAGRQLPPECHPELHTDYDGAAVRWGLTHHKESAYDCCQACLDHSKRARPGEKKCNIWVYCPSETGCYSPDVYEHKHMECWLKYAEKPRVNFKDKYSESYRNSHPNVPVIVPWVSGTMAGVLFYSWLLYPAWAFKMGNLDDVVKLVPPVLEDVGLPVCFLPLVLVVSTRMVVVVFELSPVWFLGWLSLRCVAHVAKSLSLDFL
ncbi:hypothetical protein TEA_026467 [Camellia sinensis var. sinensis]|uniref:Apple domain-containing protein n=1 Tax=Camellia sinensis var. sinensis TaxID=542762 RepID=A0A4S4EA87_CAMSN|nr:hypothetical protein TEA_026467 [Camellia sinensis var. sinensis]